MAPTTTVNVDPCQLKNLILWLYISSPIPLGRLYYSQFASQVIARACATCRVAGSCDKSGIINTIFFIGNFETIALMLRIISKQVRTNIIWIKLHYCLVISTKKPVNNVEDVSAVLATRAAFDFLPWRGIADPRSGNVAISWVLDQASRSIDVKK